MVEEALDPILIQVTVPLPVPMIFSALTAGEQLQGLAGDQARVQAEVGGPYVLAWKAPVAFESPGRSFSSRTTGISSSPGSVLLSSLA